MSLYNLDSNRIFHVTVLSCQYHVIHPYAVKLRYLTLPTYIDSSFIRLGMYLVSEA